MLERTHSVLIAQAVSRIDLVDRNLNISALADFDSALAHQLATLNETTRSSLASLGGLVAQLRVTHATDVASLNETLDARIVLLTGSLSNELAVFQDIARANYSTLDRALDPLVVTVGYIQQLIGQLYPVISCSALHTQRPFAPSGYHWVSPTDDGSMTRVYCDMNSTCGRSGGWMRVVSLDWGGHYYQCE